MAPARFRCLRLQIAWAPNGTNGTAGRNATPRPRCRQGSRTKRGATATNVESCQANEETKPEVGNDIIKGRL